MRHLCCPAVRRIPKGDPVSVSDLWRPHFISIMNQYTPIGEFPESSELKQACEQKGVRQGGGLRSLELGVENGFIQEGGNRGGKLSTGI